MQKFKKMDVLIGPDGSRVSVQEYSVQVGGAIRVYKNDKYIVMKREMPLGEPPKNGMAWLSIKRIDQGPIHDWRELQDIKTELVGPECEGVELYPAESRRVDGANQIHLWVLLDQKQRWPFGFNERLVSGQRQAEELGAKQRPFDADEIYDCEASPESKTGPKRKSLSERFWSKVEIDSNPDACWMWLGGTNRPAGMGYGIISVGGDSNGKSPLYAHRVAFALANGIDPQDIPEDVEIRHKVCDNTLCCNPSHLAAGSSKDNKQDAMLRQRMFWQRAKRDAEGRFIGEDSNAEETKEAQV